MTNINCSLACIYQKEGFCHLDYTKNINNLSNQTDCAYFQAKKVEEKAKKFS